mmetsp:Transcript_6983/g.16279  ORF Transcript_6983/g.16279 Transcript_6983/m.16279 type:complete len:101 (-) Transcript_6983:355-657(-)
MGIMLAEEVGFALGALRFMARYVKARSPDAELVSSSSCVSHAARWSSIAVNSEARMMRRDEFLIFVSSCSFIDAHHHLQLRRGTGASGSEWNHGRDHVPQ